MKTEFLTDFFEKCGFAKSGTGGSGWHYEPEVRNEDKTSARYFLER